MDEYTLIAIIGAAIVIGEVVLEHRRARRYDDFRDHVNAVLVDHDARISEIERWRAST